MQFQASPILLVLVLKAMNCTFFFRCACLEPGKAKDLIEADDIVRKAVADFIGSLLVKKICLPHPQYNATS